jgi:signal transduction histidine kinase
LSGAGWLHPYYLLVVFTVLTVCLSLGFGYSLTNIYVSALKANQTWRMAHHGLSELGQLAALADAPGNDVFETRDPEMELAKMHKALRAFYHRLTSLQQQLSEDESGEPGAHVVVGLDQVKSLMDELGREGELTFAAYQSNQVAEAAKHMAVMDRKHAVIVALLGRVRRDVIAAQDDQFDQQEAVASRLQKIEYGIVGLALVMVVAAAAYGRRVARQVEEDRKRQREMAGRTQLLKQVMAAQEDERRRIARDLHDEVGQSLTSVLLGLRGLADASTLEAAQKQTEEVRQIVSAALDGVRRLARGLRPLVLDDLGLAAALERYAADYTHAHRIGVDLDVSDIIGVRLPEPIETALYRIVQEALTNSARHAAAAHVTVQVQRRREEVHAVVRDDGRGFTPGNGQVEKSFGISGMRDRAALLGGQLVVASAPGTGTTVAVDIPLKELRNGTHPGVRGG